jgi:hypothetical protein
MNVRINDCILKLKTRSGLLPVWVLKRIKQEVA